MAGSMLKITRDPETPDIGSDIDPYALLGHLSLGVVVCEIDERRGNPVLIANEQAKSLLMITDTSIRDWCLDDVSVLEFGEPLLSEFHRAVKTQRPVHYEWDLEFNGQTRNFACEITPLETACGQSPRVMCTLADRTAEKRAGANLLHHALHDGLTGLPNRSHFLNRLEEAVARCHGEENRACAVLMLNVDRFQLINESFGHPAGDAFLIDLANSLRGCLRSADILARFNGDEFAILIDDISGLDDATGLAARIHQMMEVPRMVSDSEAYMSVSIGISTTQTSHMHPENLIRDADISMHRSKNLGRSRTEVFARDTHIVRTGQIQLETDLRKAIENEELELFYQPIIDLEQGRTIAFEALTRWHHPERGFVSPVDFIPLAEETGLILPLGRWAMLESCRQLRAWQSSLAGTKDLFINVNMSAVQFLQDDIPATVAQCLAETGIQGRNLRLEITETALVADPDGAAECLHAIKRLGPTLALDDFGTGYSSLNYLNNFPIDCIKIDRSFVGRVDRDDQSAKIIRIITMLADTLKMSVVAEGIENSEQHMMMRSLGCRYGQGFLFSRPLPQEEATAHLKASLK
ncbi:hypothetical protein JCM17844_02900 [Iodidimonas gelatinilytica]|uniref:Diguanylate cyclase n=2 Tax=Iodidimonas gelatinilytica TaxID=1236966 RepID=A0A5A7MND3_9PROT|nr:hypothetical protein JCM17844_02900 [Iodidimonas gelatinilytica]